MIDLYQNNSLIHVHFYINIYIFLQKLPFKNMMNQVINITKRNMRFIIV